MTFTITESQLQEIAGRLNSLTVQGIANSQHVVGILAVLDAVGKQKAVTEDQPDQSSLSVVPKVA